MGGDGDGWALPRGTPGSHSVILSQGPGRPAPPQHQPSRESRGATEWTSPLLDSLSGPPLHQQTTHRSEKASRAVNPPLCLNRLPSPLASRSHARDDHQLRTGHGRMTERCSPHASFRSPAPLPSWPLPSGLEPEVPKGTVLPVPGIPVPTAPALLPLTGRQLSAQGFWEHWATRRPITASSRSVHVQVSQPSSQNWPTG